MFIRVTSTEKRDKSCDLSCDSSDQTRTHFKDLVPVIKRIEHLFKYIFIISTNSLIQNLKKKLKN